jgi:hypothetical protein
MRSCGRNVNDGKQKNELGPQLCSLDGLWKPQRATLTSGTMVPLGLFPTSGKDPKSAHVSTRAWLL